ncbi:MAG: hypothetical protein H7247_15585, partial [Polaromonas sp.]|nr:hypothetical protein [Gemmatimonadaceae bacterium]
MKGLLVLRSGRDVSGTGRSESRLTGRDARGTGAAPGETIAPGDARVGREKTVESDMRGRGV